MNGLLGADGRTWRGSAFARSLMCERIAPCIFHAANSAAATLFSRPGCGESCLGPVPIFEPASCFNIYAVCVCSSELCIFTHVGRPGPCIAHDPWCVFPRRQQDSVLKIDLVSGAERCVCVRVCAYK